jgi:hypothetical protein
LLKIKLAQAVGVCALVVEFTQAGIHEILAELGFVVGAEVFDVLYHIFARIKLDLLFWSLHCGHKLSSISRIPSELLHQRELGLSLMAIIHTQCHLGLNFEGLKPVHLSHSHCVNLLLVRKAFIFFFALVVKRLLSLLVNMSALL